MLIVNITDPERPSDAVFDNAVAVWIDCGELKFDQEKIADRLFPLLGIEATGTYRLLCISAHEYQGLRDGSLWGTWTLEIQVVASKLNIERAGVLWEGSR